MAPKQARDRELGQVQNRSFYHNNSNDNFIEKIKGKLKYIEVTWVNKIYPKTVKLDE